MVQLRKRKAPFQHEVAPLHRIDSDDNDSNTAPLEEVSSSAPVADSNNDTTISTNTSSISSCKADEVMFELDLRTDSNGYETSWQIVDGKFSTVASGPDDAHYENEFKYDTHRLCLPQDECYTFVIRDVGGNGLKMDGDNDGQYKSGNYSIAVNGETLWKDSSSFGYGESTTFGNTCNSNNNNNLQHQSSPKSCDLTSEIGFDLNVTMSHIGTIDWYIYETVYDVVFKGWGQHLKNHVEGYDTLEEGVFYNNGQAGGEEGFTESISQRCLPKHSCLTLVLDGLVDAYNFTVHERNRSTTYSFFLGNDSNETTAVGLTTLSGNRQVQRYTFGSCPTSNNHNGDIPDNYDDDYYSRVEDPFQPNDWKFVSFVHLIIFFVLCMFFWTCARNNHITAVNNNNNELSEEDEAEALLRRREYISTRLLTRKVLPEIKHTSKACPKDVDNDSDDNSVLSASSSPPSKPLLDTIQSSNDPSTKTKNLKGHIYASLRLSDIQSDDENDDNDDNDDEHCEDDNLKGESSDTTTTTTATSSLLYTSETCNICLEHYQEGEEICWSRNSKCTHNYHVSCMTEWLLRHNECPCCRNHFLKADGDEENWDVLGNVQRDTNTDTTNPNSDATTATDDTNVAVASAAAANRIGEDEASFHTAENNEEEEGGGRITSSDIISMEDDHGQRHSVALDVENHHSHGIDIESRASF